MVGNLAAHPHSVTVFPEYTSEWIVNEIDDFETRPSDRLQLSDEDRQLLLEYLPRWKDRSFDKIVERALPEGAEAWMGEDVSPQGFSGAVASMVEKMAQAGKDILYSRLRGAAMVLLVSVLCGAVGSLAGENRFLPLAGCLAVTVLAAGAWRS